MKLRLLFLSIIWFGVTNWVHLAIWTAHDNWRTTASRNKEMSWHCCKAGGRCSSVEVKDRWERILVCTVVTQLGLVGHPLSLKYIPRNFGNRKSGYLSAFVTYSGIDLSLSSWTSAGHIIRFYLALAQIISVILEVNIHRTRGILKERRISDLIKSHHLLTQVSLIHG